MQTQASPFQGSCFFLGHCSALLFSIYLVEERSYACAYSSFDFLPSLNGPPHLFSDIQYSFSCVSLSPRLRGLPIRSCQWSPILTPPGPGAPRCFAACTAWGIAARLAQSPTEVLVHHGADVPLEIGEEDAAGVDVLRLWWALFLRAAFFLFYTRRSLAGKGGTAAAAAVAGAGVALLGFLHFGVIGQFLLKERKNREVNFKSDGKLGSYCNPSTDP